MQQPENEVAVAKLNFIYGAQKKRTQLSSM